MLTSTGVRSGTGSVDGIPTATNHATTPHPATATPVLTRHVGPNGPPPAEQLTAVVEFGDEFGQPGMVGRASRVEPQRADHAGGFLLPAPSVTGRGSRVAGERSTKRKPLRNRVEYGR
jgi:hypothetical protein